MELGSSQHATYGTSISRRTVVQSASAIVLGSLVGIGPNPIKALAQKETTSPLYQGGLDSADAIARAAEFYDQLDGIGSLDYSTGYVTVDTDALKSLVYDYFGDSADAALGMFLRHAELGFAVNGNPESVAAGRSTCVPWSAVEYLVNDGQRVLPIAYQYALLADLGLIDAGSEDEIAAILAKSFANVPPELAPYAVTGSLRALPAAQDNGSWLTSLLNILGKIGDSFKIDRTKFKRDILDCIRSAMVSIQWWGMRMCFDAECAKTVIEYMRAGGNALTSAAVLGAVLALKIPFWVAAIIAGCLLTWGIAAKVLADAMESALNRSGGRGACIDATWLVALFGIPAIGASPA